MFNRTDRSMLGIWWWTIDRWMLGAIMTLIGSGVLLVMAASPPVAERIGFDESHFIWRHLVFLAPALFVLMIASLMTPRMIRITCLLGLAVSFLLMTATLFGPEVKGATRWIPLGPFKLQPSEFAKPCFAIVCAWLLSLWQEDRNMPGWHWASGIGIAMIGVLVLQPDIGMSFVFAMTWALQVFLAGMPLLLVIGLAALAPIAAIGTYTFIDHFRDRVDKFFEGGNAQAETAMKSFAEGGMMGVGPGDGRIKNSLPDAHADFIFAVAGEEFGAIACLFVILVYAFIVLRGFSQAAARQEPFLFLAIAGLSMQFGVQAAIHMASSVHLIPTKGMTLPFISYGGSSLLATALTMGMILGLCRSSQHNRPKKQQQGPGLPMGIQP